MKRTSLISAVALIAVLGTATASFAHGGGKGMGARGGMMPDFATLDTDSDGKITQAEMDAHKAAKFAEIDTDSNGKISADEFAAGHEAKSEERAAKMAERKTKMITKMIEKLDTDGDGEISAEEMSAMERKSMIERLDTDDDGAISEEEFEKIGKRGHGKGGEGRGHGEGRGEGKGKGKSE